MRLSNLGCLMAVATSLGCSQGAAMASPDAGEQPSADASDEGSNAADAGLPASSYRDDAGIWHLPDPSKTPGVLCTATDPNFSMYRYAEQIAYCNRNVPTPERDSIGAAYGIPQADFANYEFDHYIPLSIGGNDDQGNLWPQPHVEALRKDVVEQQVFDGMNNGTMTQAQAIALIRAWRPY